jgi:hypothetical protein
MSTRAKNKRSVKPPADKAPYSNSVLTPAAMDKLQKLVAESWAREPEPIDPEARDELLRHRLGSITWYARRVEELTKGRTDGEDRARAARAREHIATLRGKHPDLTAKQLRAKADAKIVGHLNPRTWANLVSIVTPPKRKSRAP